VHCPVFGKRKPSCLAPRHHGDAGSVQSEQPKHHSGPAQPMKSLQLLSSREIQTSMRLLLPGEMGKHAVSEATKANSGAFVFWRQIELRSCINKEKAHNMVTVSVWVLELLNLFDMHRSTLGRMLEASNQSGPSTTLDRLSQ
ncbi:hypothetical protein EI555_002087, partial [Monodon monoceros]